MLSLDIPKRSLKCTKGGEKFTAGMNYYTLLLEDEEKKIMRQDFCLDCWKQHEAFTKSSQGYWKGKIHLKEESKSSVNREKLKRAFSLLKELKKDEANDSETFVLSLYLSHARQLILRKELKRDEGIYDLYESIETEELIPIKRINLNALDIQILQQSIATKLNHS